MIYLKSTGLNRGTEHATTKVKEAAHQLINQLPDEVSWDELAYRIGVRASIERPRRCWRRSAHPTGRNREALP